MLLLVAYKTLRLFLNLSQELTRLERNSQSPLISTIAELFKGLNVFRLYRKTEYQRDRFRGFVDEYISIFIHNHYAIIFVFIMYGTVMNVFILVSFVLICTSSIRDWGFMPQDIDFTAVTLNWILVIPSFVEILIYNFAHFFQNLSSVERMLFNVDEATSEGPLRADKPVAFDPSQGICVRNIFCQYRENLPFVLKGLSLDVRPGEKVALVGRTGSGKSSALLALTRILNVQNSRCYPRVARFQGLDPSSASA